jgi:hypothetical protein
MANNGIFPEASVVMTLADAELHVLKIFHNCASFLHRNVAVMV